MKTTQPYLVNEDPASGRGLIPLSVRNKAYDEDWLQELLFLHPSLLPINHIDESYLPLVSIGREITNIDNLFVSPSGLLTIVETKLWRNPEAHRTVVAQILEYARTLSTWSYQKLDDSVKAYMKKRIGIEISLYEAVNKAVRNLSVNEIELQAKIQDCLTNGQFALVIVGDKVYPQATQLAETIQSAPNLQFTLGFVELSCYKLEKDTTWPLIIVPNFITKTKEHIRAVVKVIYEEKIPTVQVTTPPDEPTTSRTSLPAFLASIPSDLSDIFKNYLDIWTQKNHTIYWGKVGFSLRVNWKGKPTTVFDAYPSLIGIMTAKSVNRLNFPEALYKNYRESLIQSSKLGTAVQQGRTYINYKELEIDDVLLIIKASDEFADALVKMP